MKDNVCTVARSCAFNSLCAKSVDTGNLDYKEIKEQFIGFRISQTTLFDILMNLYTLINLQTTIRLIQARVFKVFMFG